MPRIAVVEDDGNIQKLISYALESGGYEAKGFDSGDAFLSAVYDYRPDLVILDIMMPGTDGTEVLKQIRRSHAFRDIPVMMLTAKSGEIDKVRTLDLGADDYMTKPFGVMEMISRVKALLRRSRAAEDTKLSPAGTPLKPVLHFHEIALDENRHQVLLRFESGEERPELTLKEFELLLYMLHNQGLVLNREQIMLKVWGYDYQGESRTVDMHIKSLRQKLKSAGDYIRTVRGVGYRLSDDE